MALALKAILNIIVFIVVPAMLITVLSITHSITKKMEETKKYKISVHAGFWAGFILALVMVVYQISVFTKTGFPNLPIFQGFNILIFWLGAVGTFLLTIIIRIIILRKIFPLQWIGWSILFVSFICFYALLHYLFIRTSNKLILSMTTASIFGVLAYFALIPDIVHDFRDYLKRSN